MPYYLWPYAVQHFAHVHNRTVSDRGTKTPYEKLTGKQPSVRDIRVWGCPVNVYVESRDRATFGSRAIRGVNLGRDKSTKFGYFVYFPRTKTIRQHATSSSTSYGVNAPNITSY